MRYAKSVADLVGNTPLVQLTRVTDGIAATVLAKVEYFNPGGSAKDRIARSTSTLGPTNLSGTTKIMR